MTAAFRKVSGPSTGRAGGQVNDRAGLGVRPQECHSPRVRPHVHLPQAQGDRDGVEGGQWGQICRSQEAARGTQGKADGERRGVSTKTGDTLRFDL